MGAIQGVPAPELESDLEIMDTRDVSGPIPPPSEADRKVTRTPTPGVRCPTCAFENKEVWVLPGRSCDIVEHRVHETTLEVHNLFTATGVNNSNEGRLYLTPEGHKKYQEMCLKPLLNSHCIDGAEYYLIHDETMRSTSEPPSSKQTETVEPSLDPDLMMNQNELKVWKALCALEDELEVGWLPICREATVKDGEISVPSSSTMVKLFLINIGLGGTGFELGAFAWLIWHLQDQVPKLNFRDETDDGS